MNNSTSSTGYNLSYEVNRISVYILPVLVVFILITNMINIGVFCRRALWLSSCTHYFLASAVASLVYLSFSPINAFLTDAFGLSMIASPFWCRIQLFFIFSSALLFMMALTCASVDRYCASSSLVRFRRFSNPRMARKVILIITTLIIIYTSPLCIIYHYNYTTSQCEQYSNTIIVVYYFSRIVLQDIVGPLVMTTFGVLTIQNIRTHANRVTRVGPQNRRRRTEGQLSRMLIIQVGTYLLFSLPIALIYILIAFVPLTLTSLISGIRTIPTIWQLGTYFLSFFLYILSANVYRQELKKMLHLSGNQARITHIEMRPQVRMLAKNVVSIHVELH